MKVRRIIGVVLFLPITVIIVLSYLEKARVYEEFERAQVDVIFSSDELELNQTKSFKSTYRYSHGVIIRNAIKNKDNQPADLSIGCGDGDAIDVVYSEGEKFIIGARKSTISVRKESNFEGRIEFLDSVCGCENIAPSVCFFGSLLLGAVLIPIGFCLAFKITSNKTGNDNSE
jgi:hypothetical protein